MINLVAGISTEWGLEGFILTPENINSEVFLSVLNVFDRNDKEYTLLGDNASWHKSRLCKEEFRSRNLYFIYNVPYTPTLNPIENYFGFLKQHYKRLRL